MRIDSVIRIAAVHADTAEDFERKFNARIDELKILIGHGFTKDEIWNIFF